MIQVLCRGERLKLRLHLSISVANFVAMTLPGKSVRETCPRNVDFNTAEALKVFELGQKFATQYCRGNQSW